MPDSTLSLILDTINHLRERGETAQNIITDNPTRIDLAHIYSNYEAKLKDRWIDEQGRHLHLANNFEQEFMRRAFPETNLVVVEGFTLLFSSGHQNFDPYCRDPKRRDGGFARIVLKRNQNLYKNVTRLVSQFKALNIHIDTTYERTIERHQYIANNLFHTDPLPATSFLNADTTSPIKVLEPTDRSEEVEQIAHLIQKHVSAGDCKLSDICVTYYNIAQYQPAASPRLFSPTVSPIHLQRAYP